MAFNHEMAFSSRLFYGEGNNVFKGNRAMKEALNEIKTFKR